jgi:CubicO group peptidase (beta-lactamase class C family)
VSDGETANTVLRPAIFLLMKFFPLVISVALLGGCASAPPRPAVIARGDYAATQAYITDLIQHSMTQSKVTGLSIALVDDQRVVWSQGFGYANLERKAPATADTLYRVASISKLFTDTAAMQLAERGLLNIDQPVHKVLPDFAPLAPPADSAITPRQLMTHHSGLPRDKIQGFQSAAPAPFSDVVSYLNRTPTAYPPSHTFAYSNLGVTLLGSIVQKLSGTPFVQYMQQSVLAPLGMTDSSFGSSPSDAVQMSQGYKEGVLEKEWPLRDVPAAGLNSSAHDLGKFMSMVFANGRSGKNQVLKPETVADMLRPQNSAVPLDLNFQVGLGWMLSTLGKASLQNAGPVAHHAGGIGSFHSQMYLLPQHKLGVVVLANSASAGEAVDHVATAALSLALEAKTGIRQPKPSQVAWADIRIPAATLQAAIGDYATALGLVTVSQKGNTLRAQALGQSFDLRPRQDGLLGLDYALLGLFPIHLGPLSEVGLSMRPVEGHDLLIARIGTQEMRVGERITLPANLGAWRQRLGDYEIINLGEEATFVERIRLVEERGFLIAQVDLTEAPGQTLQVVLMPNSDTEARAVETLAEGGELLHVVKDNGVEQLLFSGYLLRKK